MADAECSLRQVLVEIAERNDYTNHNIDIKGFNSGGANYTSAIFFATISSSGKDDLDLFAKVAIVGEKIRNKSTVDRMFTTEQTFYNDLATVWDGYQSKYSVPDDEKFVFPKFYGGSPKRGEETVVLNNLVARGYETYNRFKSVDWQYASKAIETLAKFHALSFVFEKESPEEHEKICKELVYQMGGEEDSTKKVWERMVESSIQVLNDEHKGRVMKFMEKHTSMESFMKYYRPLGKSVLIHGDYRPSNLLYKKQDDSLQVIPVDYQTLRAGSPVSDLIYFIFVGSDQKFRENHYQQLVEHYYQQLCLALARFQIDPADVYPREKFDVDFKEMLPFAVLLGVFLLPIITVEAESAPRMDGDADFDSFVVKPNELFAQRFTELIADCIRYEII
ncbi:uncharacterized protein LOC131842187 [Achroia grisella]|uniref:uncharacterized protein LOC131842187 n=1 Tax=Achroia grisella TaxID=688607 RepID=UPI0027D28766|nr:uncharacterized protein LOC131842187 [Achroia grisella]